MSAIVVYGCQGLLHALSRDILNGFHFSRDLELMRKQLDFFSASLYPFLILFIQYVVFSALVLVAPKCFGSGIKFCYFNHSWNFVPYQYILDKFHFLKSPKTFRVIITIILYNYQLSKQLITLVLVIPALGNNSFSIW